MSFLRAVALVARKDLLSELRSREQAVTLFFFALLVLVVFNFAFDFTVIEFVSLGPGILWVAFMFSGVLALSHSFQIEREKDRILGILMSPIDRSAFYLGKVLATSLFMAAVEAVIVPVSVLMFNYRFSGRIGAASCSCRCCSSRRRCRSPWRRSRPRLTCWRAGRSGSMPPGSP